MIWLYRLLYLPLFLIFLPYYGWKMWKRGGYGRDLRHRFGFVPTLPPPPANKKRVWIQAVSVGELVAVTPLLQELSKRSDTEVVLTTTSSTGYAYAHEKLRGMVRVVAAFPWDFWACSATAWRCLKPTHVFLMEGELWPEHIHQAQKRKVPVTLLNGRVSDRSFKRHRNFSKLTGNLTFRRLAAVGAGSSQDAQRFIALGVCPDGVSATGNLKFDVSIQPRLSTDQIDSLREELGFGGAPTPFVILGSSTWPGEEAALLETIREARSQGHDARLLLVPRHAERRAELAELIGSFEWPWHQRSLNLSAPAGTIVHLADTTGELRMLTQVADVVFVGKSLPPHTGGQTPIEAAALGKALILGPRLDNFREAVQGLKQAGGALQIADKDGLKHQVLSLLKNPGLRAALGQKASSWHASNRGALARTLALIDSLSKQTSDKAKQNKA